MLIDRRESAVSSASADDVATVFSNSAQRGWLYGDWLWRLRGLLDRLSAASACGAAGEARRISAGRCRRFLRV